MNRWPEPEPTTAEDDPEGYARARQMRVVALWIIAVVVVLGAAMVRSRLSQGYRLLSSTESSQDL